LNAADAVHVGEHRPSICLVAELPPPTGGMAVQAERLGAALRSEGHRVRHIRTNALPQGSLLRRVPVIRGIVNLAMYLPSLLAGAMRSRVIHIFSNSGLSFALFSVPAIIAGRLMRKHVVVHYHGGAAPQFLANSGRLVVPLLRSANSLVVPSAYLARVFSSYGLSPLQIPNMVTPAGQRTTSEARPGPCILMARNLTPVYNVACGLRAFAQVAWRYSSAELIVAGDGPERGALDRLAQDLGVAERVKFLGNIGNDRLRTLMQRADVLLNTSRTDNQPVSIMEAFASGLPVVSTAVGGIPDLVTHEFNGLLAPDDDAQALAALIVRALQDVALRQQLVRNALASADQFTWPRIYPALVRAYGAAASQ
jgi:glycosyltransferase involved in cell wall biosynthesis